MNNGNSADHAFKNFHRLLCERFNYVHDEVYWRHDQLSLIEWIAKQVCADGGKGEAVAGWKFESNESDGRIWLTIHHPGGAKASLSARATYDEGRHSTICAQVIRDLVAAPQAECALSEEDRAPADESVLRPFDDGPSPEENVHECAPRAKKPREVLVGYDELGDAIWQYRPVPRADAEKDAALTGWANEISDWITNAEFYTVDVPRSKLVELHAAILAANKEK